jgi:hypothetical protein
MPLGSFRLNSIARLLAISPPAPALGAFGLKKVLDNPNTGSTFSTNDGFGRHSAITESFFIVSAPNESIGGSQSGSVYIYSTTTGDLLHAISNPNAFGTATNDVFGNAVSICEQYAIVGAFSEDDAGGLDSGKAYIFSNSTGSLLYTLDNPNAFGTSEGDFFGIDVGITDSYAIVGASSEGDAGGLGSGKAYIFSTGTGELLHTLNNPNPFGTSAFDNFGRQVAISESYSAVSAPGEDSATGNNRGKVYIYSNSTGNLIHTLNNPTDNQDSYQRIAISEQYTVVTALFAGTSGDEGRVYVYSNATGDLVYTLSQPGTGVFGNSVDISDTQIIVSASGRSDEGGTQSGKAYVYSTSDGSLLYTLDNPNAFASSQGDNFGASVGISNTFAIVGADQEDDAGTNQFNNTAGKAYLFTRIEEDHIAAPSPSGLTFISSVSSQGTTIQVPNTVREGDIAILFDNSLSTTLVVPSNWTQISTGSTTGIRTTVSRKILTSSDVGSTVTGMAGTTRKLMLIFRDWSTTTPTITTSTPSVQATTATPSNQTIVAGSGQSLYFGVYGRTASTVSTALNQSNKTSNAVNSVSTSGVTVRYNIFNTGVNAIAHSNATVTMSDAGTNVLISFRMDIS